MGLDFRAAGADAPSAQAVYTDGCRRVACLAGNPNVGKSTVFNGLTGLHQHTGNWTGKTVLNAVGVYSHEGQEYALVDVPGTYSLHAASDDERAARDYICFGGAFVTVVVCDASCLERNLNLVLQILEVTPRVIVAVNLMDEAARKGIVIDTSELSAALGVPVVGMAARRGRGLDKLREAIADFEPPPFVYEVRYSDTLEHALGLLEMRTGNVLEGRLSERWAALRLLEGDGELIDAMEEHIGFSLRTHPDIAPALAEAEEELRRAGLTPEALRDELVSSVYRCAEDIARRAVKDNGRYDEGQLKIDRFLTRRSTGLPVMLLLLSIIFFITIKGANLPSELLYTLLERAGGYLGAGLRALNAPAWLHDALILGVWRVLSWVVSVMLPPMAIFFPLFTLLEDLGYLPRVAFNLDNSFRRAGACGKQCLTMAMGFGCNAAGVVGCRIIDSRRERLIAVLTNSLVPCNGRFPILIALITIFLVHGGGLGGSVLSALILTLFIVLAVGATLLVSRLLGHTLLRGEPSSLTLELPPFRVPKLGEVIVRSLLDRTLFVLGRAAAVAAPAGLVIWLTANVYVGGESILDVCTGFLDPLGRLLGMDGVILTAFILGLPANETVIPIMIMAYASTGTLTGYSSLDSLREILVSNGWSISTAICTMLFTLFHWPCATTMMTVRKETGSLKWAFMAAALPALLGCAVTFTAARVLHALGL